MAERRIVMRRVLRDVPATPERPTREETKLNEKTLTEIRAAIEVLEVALSGDAYGAVHIDAISERVNTLIDNVWNAANAQPAPIPRQSRPGRRRHASDNSNEEIDRRATRGSSTLSRAWDAMDALRNVRANVVPAVTDADLDPNEPVNMPEPSLYPEAEIDPHARGPQRRHFTRRRNGVRVFDATGYERAMHEYTTEGYWRTLPWEVPRRVLDSNQRAGDVVLVDTGQIHGITAANGSELVQADVRVRSGTQPVTILIQPRAFTHSNCIHNFKDRSCGYQGERMTCNKQISDCFACRNTQNFNGSRIDGQIEVP